MSKKVEFYDSPLEGMRLCCLCGADITEELYQRTYKKFFQPMCYECEREFILKGIKK